MGPEDPQDPRGEPSPWWSERDEDDAHRALAGEQEARATIRAVCWPASIRSAMRVTEKALELKAMDQLIIKWDLKILKSHQDKRILKSQQEPPSELGAGPLQSGAQ